MPTDIAHDPVCHMDIALTAVSATSQYEGKQYSFCSPGCKIDFDKNPGSVLQAETVHHAEPKKMPIQSSGRSWWRFWGR